MVLLQVVLLQVVLPPVVLHHLVAALQAQVEAGVVHHVKAHHYLLFVTVQTIMLNVEAVEPLLVSSDLHAL